MKSITVDCIVSIRILEHCKADFTAITPLIDQTVKSSSLYRWKNTLLEKGLLETDGKNRYRTTSQGLLQLQETLGEAPPTLTILYPPLAHVPSLQHRAIIELTLAAVLARKCNLRSDRHPTIVVAGPTLTWKTSTGIFLCHMLGLDPSKQIVNLAAESGKSLWLRKSSTGSIAYKRELLDSRLVIFDEFQAADSDCKRLLSIWMDGRKNVALENQQLTIEAVPLLTLNPSKGNTLEERIGINRAQLRRSIICDLSAVKLPNLAMRGEEIVIAAKIQGPLELLNPRHDCTQHKAEIHKLFLSTLNPQGQELTDLETLTMLSSAITGFLEPFDAIRLIFHDYLLLCETIGWAKPGWTLHVNNFPTTVTPSTAINNTQTSDETISNEDLVQALEHLEAGGTISELVTKKHFTLEKSEHIAKKYNELKSLDAKVHTHIVDAEQKDQDVLKLEREVRIAELQQKKAELQKPLEIDRCLTTLNATLDASGKWRQEHCSHIADIYCMYWRWEQRPNSPYQVGEPILKDGRWFIQPTYSRCSVCCAYHHRDTPTTESLELRLSTAERRFQKIDNSIATLNTTIKEHGEYKLQNCRHLQNGYCMLCSWSQRPNDCIMVGKPLLKDAKWRIHPTCIYCALCPDYSNKGVTNIQTVDASVKEIHKILEAIPTSNLKKKFTCSNCRSKEFVAVKIRCTKCKTETWFGWEPPK